MKELQISDFPLEASSLFHPGKVLHIRQENLLAPSFHVTDVTEAAGDTADIYQHPELGAKIEAYANAQQPILDVIRRTWRERTLDAVDASKTTVAELSGPLLSLGRWTLTFADASHSEHPIEIRPTGMGHKADVFVKDSIPYFWDPLDGRCVWELYKVVEGKRVKVAVYSVGHHWNRNGVLGVDTTKVDELVAVMSCIAAIGRSDSFRK